MATTRWGFAGACTFLQCWNGTLTPLGCLQDYYTKTRTASVHTPETFYASKLLQHQILHTRRFEPEAFYTTSVLHKRLCNALFLHRKP